MTFAALADPTRRQVLEHLARGPATVSELADPHELTLAGMLKHLRLLERAGLLRTEKDGRVRRCGISARPMRTASRYLDRYRQIWERRLSRLDRLVSNPASEETER